LLLCPIHATGHACPKSRRRIAQLLAMKLGVSDSCPEVEASPRDFGRTRDAALPITCIIVVMDVSPEQLHSIRLG
jgi:hypothetical protein